MLSRGDGTIFTPRACVTVPLTLIPRHHLTVFLMFSLQALYVAESHCGFILHFADDECD